MKNLRLWIHPSNGEERIYINNGQDAKVWVIKTDDKLQPMDWGVKYKAYSRFDFGVNARNFSDAAYSEVIMALEIDKTTPANKLPSFNELKEMAK